MWLDGDGGQVKRLIDGKIATVLAQFFNSMVCFVSKMELQLLSKNWIVSLLKVFSQTFKLKNVSKTTVLCNLIC